MKPAHLALIAAAAVFGCALDPAVKPWWTLNERSFDDIKPGISKADVTARLGKPLLVSSFPNLMEEIWEYRLLNGTRIFWAEVHFDSRSGSVKYFTDYPDPAFYAHGPAPT